MPAVDVIRKPSSVSYDLRVGEVTGAVGVLVGNSVSKGTTETVIALIIGIPIAA